MKKFNNYLLITLTGFPTLGILLVACIMRKVLKHLWQSLQNYGNRIAIQNKRAITLFLWGRVLVLLLVLAWVLLVTQSASAFKPNEAGHLGITRLALQSIVRIVQGKPLMFSERAIAEVLAGNRSTDIFRIPIFRLPFPSGSFFDSKLHFDNESLPEGSNHLITLKQNIIKNITSQSPNGQLTRFQLGTALHMVQDYYAHSNWVDRGNTVIDFRLGRSVIPKLRLDQRTAHPDDRGILFEFGLTHDTTGYFAGLGFCGGPENKVRHGTFSCSGINKDEPGRSNFDVARDLAIAASQDYVNQILDDPRVANNPQAIKALMDIEINGTLAFVIDRSGSMLRPPVNRDGQPVGNRSRIDLVKSDAENIVRDVQGTNREPEDYLLVTFSDPFVGNPLRTIDPDVLLGNVQTILPQPGEGGDCPELYYTALLKAVNASNNGSRIYAVTDGSAKDANIRGNVAMAAKSKQIKIEEFCFFPCKCPPESIRFATKAEANSPFVEEVLPEEPTDTQGQLFAETGGQSFLLSSEADLKGLSDLILPSMTGNFVSLFSVRGTLFDPDSQEFDVPIDSSVSNVVFSVSIDNPDFISLLRPSGDIVTPNDPGVTIRELTFGSIITVNAPESGAWHLQVTGSGAFSVKAQGNTPLQFANFQFVTLTGRPEHEGFAPTVGNPLIDANQTGLADLIGPYATADFRLIDEMGDTIQSVNLEQGNSDAATDEFVGTFALPTQPFGVAVSGLDSNDHPYQRIFPTLFRAQAVEVTVGDFVPSLPAGATSRISFVVRNLGDPATFQIVVANDQGFVSLVEPTSLTLGTGATGTVNVALSVPRRTSDGTDVLISAMATSTDNPSVTNGTLLNLNVTNTVELLPYQASGYRFLQIPLDSMPPSGWEQPDFDDSAFNMGSAAFGSGGDCPLQSTAQTSWEVNTELLVRRVVEIPAGVTNVRILASVDNDIRGVFFNGTFIGNQDNEDCPILDEFQFDVPQSLVQSGENLVAFHVKDRGIESFFDTRILIHNPTAITLVSFTAEAEGDRVTLVWQTASELDNEGFNLWRSETADGEYIKLNPNLIPAQGNADTGASYTYTDTNVVKGITYYYKLEDVDTSGVSAFHGPVSATPGAIRQTYLPVIRK